MDINMSRLQKKLKLYTFIVVTILCFSQVLGIDLISTGGNGDLFSANIYFLTCTETWTCEDWGGCSGGTQTRTCTDTNHCGTYNDIPSLSQSCSSGGGGAVTGTTNKTKPNITEEVKPSEFIDMVIKTNKYAYLQNETINVTVNIYFNYYDSKDILQTRLYEPTSAYFDLLSSTSGYGRTYLTRQSTGVYTGLINKRLDEGTYTIRAYATTIRGTVTEDKEIAVTHLENIVNMIKKPRWWVIPLIILIILILAGIGGYAWFKRNYKRL